MTFECELEATWQRRFAGACGTLPDKRKFTVLFGVCHCRSRVSILLLSRDFTFDSNNPAMSFGDLKTEKGVKALNDFLADKSYIQGYA